MIPDSNSTNSISFNSSPVTVNLEVELSRKEVKYENHSKKFLCLQRNFKKQFAHIYAGRLKIIKERLILACSTKWGKNLPIRKLSELNDENNEKCIVIGTLFKHQELKPSILKEISKELQITPQPVLSNYVSEDDQLILEDEIQRIKLKGNFDIKKLVTGIVVGLLGFENEEGKFEVEDMCFGATIPCPQKPILNEDCYVLLVSGINLASAKNVLELELLIDWIKGEFGSVQDQKFSAKICRVLIVGNSVSCSESSNTESIIYTEVKDNVDTLQAIKQLDDILVDLAETVEVDIMPGAFDPSNYLMPQQPFFECLFPKASKYESFQCVTNPYEFSIEGTRLLGTSGQPIHNIKSLSNFNDSLDILEHTLKWGHLAPTAPDTQACYPYYNEDPFIISEQPHIYFAGNQPEYATKVTNINGQKTRLVSIPEFHNSQLCILINLKNLESTPMTFKV